MRELINRLEKYLEQTAREMEASVEALLGQAPPVLTEEKFALFEQNGNRTVYEADYFGKRRFLTLYGVAAIRMKEENLERLGNVTREQLCDKLRMLLLDVCAEECWALPAHVNRQTDLNWRNTIDLFASETAQCLAHIVDVVGDWLGEDCCSEVIGQVRERVVDPFYTNPDRTAQWWEQCHHNWNAVCNGSIASAYLHALREGEEGSAAYLARTCDDLTYFIEGYGEDGTCMEGLGYYIYGMTYFTHIAGELYEATGGEIDLFRGEWDKYRTGEADKRARIAAWWSQCFFASGLTVSFSDGSSRGRFRVGLGCALAERFPEVKLPDFKMAETFVEDHCARFVPYLQDYFAAKHYLEYLKKQAAGAEEAEAEKAEAEKAEAEKAEAEKSEAEKAGTETAGMETVGMDSTDFAAAGQRECEKAVVSADLITPTTAGTGEFIILDSAQWCIGKAANGAGMACKGGHNEEPHNHNDIGSFLYVVGEEMLLADLGAGEYTKEYFSDGRYNIFCNHSFSHNVPIIAGQGQKAGREYACSKFLAQDERDTGRVTIDYACAYEEGLIEGLSRELLFDKRTGELRVTDTFGNKGQKLIVTENLVTRYEPVIEEGGIILAGPTGSCRIGVEMPDKKAPHFRVTVREHSNHQGNKEPVYQIQWDVSVQEETSVKTVIKTEIKTEIKTVIKTVI